MQDCIFCRIISKNTEAEILFEDDVVIVFRDIAKRAPLHILVVPKEHIDNNELCFEQYKQLVGHMVVVAGEMARKEGFKGYKLVWNIGKEVGQVVPHGHLHVLAGKKMSDL